ncbi:hypothetical protein PIB30_022814 [Stylosanthes scabra]|uniref:Uncharacterized protein n=1 Tax=Stylosanthes scabra TaxID=79078 RepID=A0ABU6U9R7_9FABA|nr:hypothetical protein [Stylosanthes scabra]
MKLRRCTTSTAAIVIFESLLAVTKEGRSRHCSQSHHHHLREKPPSKVPWPPSPVTKPPSPTSNSSFCHRLAVPFSLSHCRSSFTASDRREQPLLPPKIHRRRETRNSATVKSLPMLRYAPLTPGIRCAAIIDSWSPLPLKLIIRPLSYFFRVAGQSTVTGCGIRAAAVVQELTNPAMWNRFTWGWSQFAGLEAIEGLKSSSSESILLLMDSVSEGSRGLDAQPTAIADHQE